MAAQAAKKQFALDTNVLIDLGERKPFALAFLEAYAPRGLAASPTVIQELTSIAFSNHHATKYAFAALSNMRVWNIAPFDLMSVGHGIAEVNTRKLIEHGVLPDDEFNDGSILIETALACIPYLVTSDKHLLSIDQPTLVRILGDFHLPPVQIFHPKALLRAAQNS